MVRLALTHPHTQPINLPTLPPNSPARPPPTRQVESFDANFSALHVRESNHAAFHLYSQTLKYEINEIEKGCAPPRADTSNPIY